LVPHLLQGDRGTATEGVGILWTSDKNFHS
jgi:hypothetical protein